MKPRKITLAPFAVFFGASIVVCGQQPARPAAGPQPVRNLRLRGLPDSGTLEVILVNAQSSGPGQPCRKSKVEEVPFPSGLSATGLFKVAERVEPGCWCDDPAAGLAVLAPDRSMAYFGRDMLCAPRLDGTLTVELRPRREIRVEVWARDATLRRLAMDELANADWILDNNLTGLTLRPNFNPPAAEVSKTTCANAAKSGRYVPGVINLYYGVGSGNAAGSNLSCGNGPIVLVTDVPSLGDAAHEISHKLGLNVRDHHLDYPEGHTTNKRGYSCSNTMWTRTDTLKHLITPGQAFWMNLSCTSFAAFQGPCLACGTRDGAPSPCPPFALGLSDEDRECPRCTVAEARAIVGQFPRGLASEAPVARPVVMPNEQNRARFCEGGELETKLRERHNVLSARAAAGGLKLGSASLSAFLGEWSARIGVSVAIEATARGEADQAAGLDFLNQQFSRGRLKGSSYIIYSAQNIKNGKFKSRCHQDEPQPEEEPPATEPAKER